MHRIRTMPLVDVVFLVVMEACHMNHDMVCLMLCLAVVSLVMKEPHMDDGLVGVSLMVSEAYDVDSAWVDVVSLMLMDIYHVNYVFVDVVSLMVNKICHTLS